MPNESLKEVGQFNTMIFAYTELQETYLSIRRFLSTCSVEIEEFDGILSSDLTTSMMVANSPVFTCLGRFEEVCC